MSLKAVDHTTSVRKRHHKDFQRFFEEKRKHFFETALNEVLLIDHPHKQIDELKMKIIQWNKYIDTIMEESVLSETKYRTLLGLKMDGVKPYRHAIRILTEVWKSKESQTLLCEMPLVDLVIDLSEEDLGYSP
jgi:hypothetical protein